MSRPKSLAPGVLAALVLSAIPASALAGASLTARGLRRAGILTPAAIEHAVAFAQSGTGAVPYGDALDADHDATIDFIDLTALIAARGSCAANGS